MLRRVRTTPALHWGRAPALQNVFLQPADGIRDIGVTGVETCALPISSAAARSSTSSRSSGSPFGPAGRVPCRPALLVRSSPVTMFVDRVVLHVQAGDGGHGCASILDRKSGV